MQQEVEVQGLRLSPQQKRLWEFQQDGAVSHAQAVIRFDGVFDVNRLRTVLRKVVSRHQSLRTSFYREPGVKIPFQVISDQDEVLWRCLDLQRLEGSRQQEAVEAELTAGRAASVTWERSPLLSATWCVFSPERSVLLLDIPALCADRYSLQNLVREIGRWYGGAGVDEVIEDPVQYVQFSEWHNELLTEGEAETGRGWWAKQHLASYPALTLPFERPSDTSPACFSPHVIQQHVPHDVVTRLEQIAHDRQTSLEVTLYVCWQTWLARVTRQRDLVCWWRCHGRQFNELREGIGLFEKWVPVYGLVDPQMSVHDLLSRAVQAHAQAIEWQEYFPSETNSGQLNALTDPIGFEYERVEGPCRIEQGTLALERSILSTEPFKLRLSCSQQDRVLRLTWHYSPNRIPHEALQCIVDQFTVLLRSVTEHVDDPIEMLDMVGIHERQRLIRTLNETVRPYDGLAPLHRLFELQASRQPDAPALVAGDRALTYTELNATANQVAHGLIRRGVKRGDCVGLCFERSAEMIIGLLGVLKAGAAYVPVDPAHAAVRLAPLMTQSGAKIILAQSEPARPWAGFDGTVLGLGESSSFFAAEPDTDPDLPISPDDLAYVMYTSGSTGVPKGVAITHGNAANYTRALCRQLDVQEPAQFATVSTLSADLGNTAIFPSLASGGCLHIITYETATDGQLFSAYLARHPIDVLKIVPSHFKALMVTANGAQVCPRKYLIMGGERLSCELADHVMRQAACAVMNHYGPTETTIGALTCPVLQTDERRLSIDVPIGRPVDNLEAFILDKRLDTVPVGVPGELYLGGEGLARGYLGQPDRTAERFVPHLHTSRLGARLYRTGDVARFWPDGRIEFLGRVDHQVKIRGFRIELGEIEAALAQHPAVQDAVVTAHEDRHGEDNLAAYLVLRGPEADGRTIQDFLRSRLPDYMIPTMVMFLPAMPLTANGKVDRHALPEPDQGRSSERMFVAPRTATEEILAGLWSEVLKRDAVGVQDNFFDLGGHSLLATQVMSRLRQAFHVELPLRTLFDAPSIAQLAEVVDSARTLGSPAPSPAMLPVPRSGPIPLSFAQQRLWLLAQFEPDSAAYNIPIALRVLGPLDTVALQQSFDEVVRRHEVLRTTFMVSNGEPTQIIALSLTIPLPVIDLQHLPPPDRQVAAERLAAAEAQRPFDLQYGPLLRINALRLNPDEHVLLLTLHHIVSDAWSAHVLVREVTALYGAFVVGRPSPLSDLPIQYADFSQWQHAWLSGSVLERELGYWKEVLSGELPILHLPTDRPRPVIQSSHGAIETLVLSREISAASKELSRRTSATIYMTLLTAWYLLLFRYTGQKDLIIGTPIANRTRREVESLIGFFVNTLAMRLQVDGYSPVSEIIAKVREACLEAYAHQETPFEKLVEVLQPRRDVGRAPIFQVMFDLQNAPSSELDVQSLEFLPLEVDSRTAKFDLSMTVQEVDHQFAISIEYNSDLFDAVTIQRMLRHYELLLNGMATSLETRVIDVPLLTQEERQHVIAINRASEPAPVVRCVHEMFEAQVGRTADATAVVWHEQSLSYRELNAKSNQLARFLREQGIGPEKRVGICMDRSLDMVVTLLGIMKAGGVYVPIDPRYPVHRRSALSLDAELDMLVADSHAASGLGEFPVNRLSLDDSRDEIARFGQQDLVSAATAHNAAYVIYTSGSTGTPKGVVISHRALSLHVVAAAARYGVRSSDRALQFAGLSFDVATEELFSTWLSGATVVLQPCRLFDSIPAFVDFVAQQQINIVGLPASYWQSWVVQMEETAAAAVPSNVRVLIVGNEPVSSASLAVWQRHLGSRVRWLNAYGPTEATITATVYEPDLKQPLIEPRTVPIGRPMPTRSMYVLDAALQPVAMGISGELYLGGESLSRGYLNRPELTADKFVPDFLGGMPGARLYKTGDRVRLRTDGIIEFLGRIDDQVKLRGYRIELGEIEAVLRQHPDVQEAVVVILDDAETVQRLVSYVVYRSDGRPESGSLLRWLGESLPDYMIPSRIVSIPHVPRTSGGKVDRTALPTPEWSKGGVEAYALPHTPMQIQLAKIWSELLGIERVGIHDNFFDLGGHSLLAVQLISRIQRMADHPLSLMDLFQAPTVERLATMVKKEHRSVAPEIVTLRAGGGLPPVYCFDPTGTHVQAYRPLASSLASEQPVYGLSLNHIFSLKWQEVSLNAIAEQHARLIHDQQPRGPYRLLGWSNGGVLAFATARVLERRGESVDFLGVLDTQPDVAVYASDNPTPVDELVAYIRRDREEAFNSISERERDALQQGLTRLSEDERLEYAIRWAQERSFLSIEEADASIGVLKLGYAVAKQAALFMNASRAQPVDAPISVWWTTNTLQRHGKEPVDWSDYTTGPVTVDTVAGDHMEAVQSIQVHQRVSEILSGRSKLSSTRAGI